MQEEIAPEPRPPCHPGNLGRDQMDEMRAKDDTEQHQGCMIHGCRLLKLASQHKLEVKSRLSAYTDDPSPTSDNQHNEDGRAHCGVSPENRGQHPPSACFVELRGVHHNEDADKEDT
mmetsp:Transcript_23589/g.53663  ORF Transcript_23589/g.53663 Transcript_23589/m.53663 type:complete len:117 (-) Transcript_23589:96-446(-)